jgi:glycosyltransferase involved in cell wall biosynthesis
MLGKLTGNASFFEILIQDRIPVPASYGGIIRHLLDHYGIAGDALDCAEMISARDSDPVGFFDTLALATAGASYASMSCKIFSHQISLDHLDALLARPDIKVIFLTRSRINRYISGMKGQITNAYANQSTTDLRPELNLRQFLRHSFDLDRALEAMHERVAASGVHCTYLNYETDLDVAPDLRLSRVSDALKTLGWSTDFRADIDKEFYAKQDANGDWRNKISNGFEVAAALAGMGLADYVEQAPITSASRSLTAASASAVKPKDSALLEKYSNYRILSKDPLITFSAIDNDRSYLAEWMAGPAAVFPLSRGLHFVKPTWSMEQSPLADLVASFKRAEACNPGHRFVVLHATALEADRFRAAGQLSMAANSSVFTDETPFALDAEPYPGLATTDALYIARFADWKNHHLAAGLRRPLFVYGEPKEDESSARYAQIRALCPEAQFVNHASQDGTYRYLTRAELNGVMSCARLSLALSTVEGFMRGSIESLLAGLPVVSVPSSGGRDQFYTADTALIVEPTAEAVAKGVAEMCARNLSREEVRRTTLELLTRERRRFLEAANRLAQEHFGPSAPEITLEPLLDFTVRYSTLGQTVELLT